MNIGDVAPDFTLNEWNGQSHSLHNARGHRCVVYFYPKDDTPGCTIQAKEFSRLNEKFTSLGIRVFGISGGDETSKKKFCSKHELNVTLLSDSDFAVAKQYQCFGPKKFMGREYDGISRNTFVVAPDGTIEKIFEKADPETNAIEILEFLGEGS